MAFAKRFAMLFAVGLAVTAPPHALGASPPETLSHLLARMRVQSGPVWDAHLTSVSHVLRGGETVDLKSETQGLRFASYDCKGALCEGQYFDGERLYAININGTTLPESGGTDPLLRAERTIASLAFLAPDFVAQGGRIVDDGTTSISGVPYRTLLVSNGDATPMLVYVDQKTASVQYMRDVNGDMTLEYRDYTQVGGRYELPLEVLQNGSLLERYDRRDEVSTPFEAPHGPVPAFATRPAVVPTDPSLTTPVFACTLGGVATTCLLDSGNSGMSVSLELAEQLNAPSVGSFRVRGLGDYATEVVHIGALQIGSMTFPSANYVVLHDIDRLGYQVVVGADLLAATTVDLDNAAHRVVFGGAVPRDGYTVPLAFDNFVPSVDVLLGTLPSQLTLDTGDESSINLAFDFYQEHHELFQPTRESTVSGVGGSSVELQGTIPLVQLGGYSIEKSDIGATPSLPKAEFGHIGAGLLAHFNVTIDYAAGMLHFVPLTKASPNP
ncbi:MAG TPA: hypothetical protein VMB20_14900 [Candidatus Acidoferrum sp.]|nr:hypothetical protein [Candidatus Acidoferrum sp.]